MFAVPIRYERQRARGLTLVELMVALAIISLLAGIALPSVKNSIQGQKLARSASLVQSIIQEGQSRSISRGGGGGVYIERLGDASIYERCQSIQIRLVDAPLPYSGDAGVPDPILGVDGAGVPSLWFHPSAAQLVRSAGDIRDFKTNNPAVNVPLDLTLINHSNLVQIEGAGKPMPINQILFGSAAARNNANLTPLEVSNATEWIQVILIPSESNSNYSDFVGKRVRVSITKSTRLAAATPLELPTGTAIDLTASGIGRYGNQFSPMQIQGNYMNDGLAPFGTGPFDYRAIWILFGARGEISRVLSGTWNGTNVVVNDIPVTGDVHLLIGEAGLLKPFPEEQLEDQDDDPLADEADDGTTPLLNSESIWVTIKAHNGEVVTSSWIDPTDEDTSLIPNQIGSPDNDLQRAGRVQKVISLTRSGAVETQDIGSR